jgi:hypothetical protein
MLLPDAIEMLADSGVEALGPTTWADLGCGDGTFTLALAAASYLHGHSGISRASSRHSGRGGYPKRR